MAANSAIEWTDHTFNCWHGCVKVSPACAHCYAEALAGRFGTEWGKDARRKFFGDAHWRQPVQWNAKAEQDGVRRKVFCASMADVFERLPDGHPDSEQMTDARARLCFLIETTPHLDWLLLTKRPENVRRMTPLAWNVDRFPANVWVGVTAEDQKRADERIPLLLQIPAIVRFLSMEPLLGQVDVRQWLGGSDTVREHGPQGKVISQKRDGLNWVIVGGESGPQARPTHPDWASSLRDQCLATHVPFFFKQWGEWLPFNQREPYQFSNSVSFPSNTFAWRVGKKVTGRLLDGEEWSQFPKGANS